MDEFGRVPPKGELVDFGTAKKNLERDRKKREAGKLAQERQNKIAQAGYFFSQGSELEDSGDFQGAMRSYARSAKLNPENRGTWVNLGTVYYKLKNLHFAETFFRKAIEIDPEYALAWYNLANVLDDAGEKIEAIKAYEKSIQFDSEYVDAYFNLALLLELENPIRALKYFQQFIQRDPQNLSAGTAQDMVKRLKKRLKKRFEVLRKE